MKKSERAASFALVFPALVIFCLVVVYPFVSGIYVSLTDWDGVSKSVHLVGLDNFVRVFTTDTLLGPFSNTLFFTTFLTLGANVLALLIAVAIQRNTWTNRLLRSVFFLPFIISLVVASYLWTYLYSAGVYPLFHIPNPLGSVETANLGISIISVWRNTGYCLVVYIAALQTVPEALYEAAELEGAGLLTRFFRITLPSIVPAFTVNVTLLLGWGLKEFETVMAATNGGPGEATVSIAFFIYKATFTWGQAGFGQAVSLVLLAGIVLATSFVAKIFRSQEVEN